MINEKELQIEMIKNDVSVEGLSDVLGISRQATYKKINGTTPFTLEEVRILKTHFKWSDKTVKKIFLI